jgi:hypothetical protein
LRVAACRGDPPEAESTVFTNPLATLDGPGLEMEFFASDSKQNLMPSESFLAAAV